MAAKTQQNHFVCGHSVSPWQVNVINLRAFTISNYTLGDFQQEPQAEQFSGNQLFLCAVPLPW